MMMSSLATATLAVGLLAATPQSPKWESSYGKALEATRAGSSPLLVVLDKPKSSDARIEPELLSQNSASGKEFELLRPYELCHVDVTTEYGQKVASAFRAKSFPHVAIIDKTGSLVLFRKSGKIDAAEWDRALSQHKSGERTKSRPVTHMTYRPIEPMIYSSPSGSNCPSCQRGSF
jgi:hypothetical protein